MNEAKRKLTAVALGYLHVIVGVEFLVKGLPKIENAGNAARYATGIHFPAFMGWFPTIIEPIGGALLILGLATRWVGIYFMAEMFVTGVISKIIVRGVPFTMPANQPGSGFELDALIFGGVFVLVIFGAGPLALDYLVSRMFKRRRAPQVAPVVLEGAGAASG